MAVGVHPALAAMRAARAEHLAVFEQGGLDGLAVHRALSAAMDTALGAIWSGLPVPAIGVGLVALGGYGRGLLAPGSDVDLMILHDGVEAAGVEGQALFYALWDAGVKVGHAVRTPKESLALARSNLEAETSFLDARLLAGDAKLFASFVEAAHAQTRARGQRFIDDVRAMMRVRHRTHGSATSQLEPNIKDGTGGLRDLHVLDWFAQAVGDLVALRLLDDEDRAELDAAHALLLTARAQLHLVAGGANDILVFDQQRPIAMALGYRDGEVIAEDAFMRDVFAATRAVELTVTGVAADLGGRGAKAKRSAPRAGCFRVVGERVQLDGDLDLEARPEDALTLFTLGATPGAEAMRAVRRALRDRRLEMTPKVRAAFATLLSTAPGSLLEMADHAGVFAALFPEWDAVRLQPQRNVYHRYTVDAHLFYSADAMARLLRGADVPLVERVVADVGDADRELLLIAALFHDVGKGTAEEHCARGERLAHQIARRLDLDAAATDDLAWLVREHLLFVDAATRRDLSDAALLEDLAARVGTQRRARLLFLLTVADGIGTGPAAWTPWKADLVVELFTKIVHVLERGSLVTSDLASEARERIRASDGLAGADADVVAAHLDGMPRAYVLRFEPDRLVRHAALMSNLAPREIRTIDELGAQGTGELTVAAHDEPGLFRRVSGVLSLHGLSIVAAEVHTRRDGVALEWFRCIGPRGLPIEAERWRRVAGDLERAVHGRLALEARIAEKRAAEARRPKGKREPPKVSWDLDAGDQMTILEVHATDRLGLLHDITAGLEACDVDVHRAKIATYGDDVVDVFYVRALDGGKISEPEHLLEIERAILHRLA